MIREALDAYATATARVFEGRQQTIGASDRGQCAGKIFCAKNAGDRVYGTASDEDYADPWGAALRGRLFEEHFWVPALRAWHGTKLLYAGNDQRTLVSGFLSATPDGLLIGQPCDALAQLGVADVGGDGSRAVECKTPAPPPHAAEPRAG